MVRIVVLVEVITSFPPSQTSSCGLTKCTKIHCTAGPLKERNIAYVYVRSRLFLTTLEEVRDRLIDCNRDIHIHTD